MDEFIEFIDHKLISLHLRVHYRILSHKCELSDVTKSPNSIGTDVLSCSSKLLEKVVYDTTVNFLNKFDVICDNQYGF